jgi:hypothetical protein
MEEALKFVEKQLPIRNFDEWYGVSIPQLRALGVDRLFGNTGGLFEILVKHRPGHPWQESKFAGIHHFGKKLFSKRTLVE